MKLIPRELDKLKLSAAGALAQRRLARGVRLNYPEATALIASQVRRTARRWSQGGEAASYVFLRRLIRRCVAPPRSAWSSSATDARWPT